MPAAPLHSPETRAKLVAHAQESIARGSKSFALASRLFDKRTREQAWLLYSWCRKCDDLADGQEHGGALSTNHDPHAALAHIRDLTARALSGETTGDPAFDALGLVTAECAIPHKYALDLVEGLAMDADGWHPRTEADLLKYCYHVAGTVGCMMAVIMGVDPADEETMKRASDLGLAFQLANIDIISNHYGIHRSQVTVSTAKEPDRRWNSQRPRTRPIHYGPRNQGT